MRSSEGRHQAIEYAPRLAELMVQYQRLNSREARVAFIDTWLKTWAYNFEKTWPVIYQALEWVEQEELYKDPRVMNPDEIYPDFKSFFEARLKRPFTLWMELEQTHHYVSKYAPELIDKTWGDVRAKAAEHYSKVNADDLANKAASRPGQRTDLVEAPRPKRDLFDNNQNVVQEVKAPVGNTIAAALRRLRKDRPDIHQRVLDAEITAHAGMVEAGFRKKPASKKLTMVEMVWRLWLKMTPEQRDEFRAKIDGDR